jgi:CTP synthase
MSKKPKYIFVIGGVMSSVGKGVTSASIGTILQSKKVKITNIKCEMYVNIDAGTIRPTEHGEIFVGIDGTEADQDLGNYERFTEKTTTLANYITTGQVYQEIIRKERNLEYKGEDVEVVPDVPNEIIRRIDEARVKDKADIAIIEIGGTAGEYQNVLFLEAARMLKYKNPDDVCFILVSYLPVPPSVGEMKTKPTQYATRTLNSAGIQPDFIVCRSVVPIDKPRKQRLSTLCSVQPDRIISAPDVKSIYEIPVLLERDDLGNKILKTLKLKPQKSHLENWEKLIQIIKSAEDKVTIGIVGKYFGTGKFNLGDSYVSIIEAIKHAAWHENLQPEIKWIDSSQFEKADPDFSILQATDGIIIGPGFGSRGTLGKIKAIEYARTHNLPLLGICFGMQLSLVEFAQNVLGLKKAHSTEIDPQTPDPVIDLIPEQKAKIQKKKFGGSMRLGPYNCVIKKDSLAFKLYGTTKIKERHRHRWEFNDRFKKEFEKNGMVFSGINPEADLVEISEFPKHKFFIGCQFHPEFQSRPLKPHPLFLGLVKAGFSKKG